MLHYLTAWKEFWGGFNLLSYISFRAGGAALTALIISMALGPGLIERLKRYKVGQMQRPDGPSSHLNKAGTPTMGGLLILLSLLISVLLWARLDNRFIQLLLVVTLGLAAVGFGDDYQKLVKKNSRGVPSRLKFLVQGVIAFGAVLYLDIHPPNPQFLTSVTIPYSKATFIDLGPLYFMLAMLIITGASNAVNLTDGLDGLAAGSIILCAMTYAVFAYVAGHAMFSQYLRIVPVPGAGEVSVFLAALMGACLGFLWFNAYPAEIFMGDTSSLFMGGIIGTAAIAVKQELILPIVGGVFLMETLSVILQMTSYKLREGKRVFKMAPLHHHFELSGWAEPKVTVRFWIAGIILMLLSFSSLKIR
ncbi:MAG: phospho-N-acetylmuramoyl-pentapeptide-transferase [Elusimicrobia bacterium]|nr:phospho-N-acetylmuramoyl-pentapeptide-transferase [Elusimicrobiota bacterium]